MGIDTADRLNRNDIIEKRAKCVVCGYELTYPEYINDDKCIWHSEFKPQWGFLAWLRFAIAEYRVMQRKLNMAKRGLTVHDYIGCLNVHAEEIRDIKSPSGMEALLRELKSYKVAHE
jgi:hypothetical protein